MTSPLRNIMLTVAYEGTAYCGWQVQPNGLSVQECLERATERLTGTRSRVLCAGRTDAGVHALGQVASFRTASGIPGPQFRRGLQRFLPDDITVVAAREATPEFHATYSAIRKRYRYLIFDGAVRPPFLRHLVCPSKVALNVAAMRQALPALLGTHDFRCFESQYPNKATSVRTVMDATLSRVPHWTLWNSDHNWLPEDARPHEDPTSPVICFEIMADGFLYNMVRAVVGTLLRIGRGLRPPDDMQRVIASLDRSQAGSTAPPEGLYLVRVDYPPELLHSDIAADH
ncbi:MAG: tRNA pseudouridine(38-40) synthase TruA [Fuerstiella sp.]